MLIRTSLVAVTLLLSACGSDPVSRAAPIADPTISEASDPSAATGADSGTDSSIDPQVNRSENPAEGLFSDQEIETSSGLIYQVMTPAEGPKPSAESMVTLNYVGTLTDGTIFDSSYSRGEPSTFQLTNTIAGFKEGVQLMSVGSRYRFTIPSYLAYGEQGVGQIIGPGDTLIFEVELLEINSM
jgi:FKBP-type peptidyl-prolyl cis-trans isomerase